LKTRALLTYQFALQQQQKLTQKAFWSHTKFAAWIVPSNSHSSQRVKLGLMLVHLKSSKLD
jgi:hypothetical protein